MPTLPQELTDYIVDFLHDDEATLYSCALVCRAWLPTAQLHLFDDVVVRGVQQLTRFLAIVSTVPHFATFTRTLRLSSQPPDNKPQNNYARAILCNQSLKHILENVPRLEVLHIDLINFTYLSSPPPDKPSKFTLRVLSLWRCHPRDSKFEDYLGILNLFSAIGHLKITHGSFLYTHREAFALVPTELRVDAVDLRQCYPSEMWMRLIRDTSIARSLTSLAMLSQRYDEYDVTTLPSLMEIISPRLQNLELFLEYMPEEYGSSSPILYPCLCKTDLPLFYHSAGSLDVGDPLHLAKCGFLRRLALKRGADDERRPVTPSWPTVCSILATLGSCDTLQELIISHRISEIIRKPESHIVPLKRVLARFTALKTLSFIDSEKSIRGQAHSIRTQYELRTLFSPTDLVVYCILR